MTQLPCYVSGSRIRAVTGYMDVEDIVAGDQLIALRDGEEVVETVTWVGHRSVDRSRDPAPEYSAPVRIRKDAIAAGQPSRDLLVSPEHCIFIDGKFFPARTLVNGGTIVNERDARHVTFHHIETERHSVLLAEDLPAESFLNTGNRNELIGSDEPLVLHPRFAVNPTAERWNTDAAAPLARTNEEIEPVWRRLMERSESMGYVPPSVRTDTDAALRAQAHGRVIRPVSDGADRVVFVLPAATESVVLSSRFAIPADLPGFSTDNRRLGVRVRAITVQSEAGESVIALDSPSLTTGWQEVEHGYAEMWRWTNGEATLTLPPTRGAITLTLRAEPLDAYPVYDSGLRLTA
ncbi:MAG: Hint domain-containing protein [Rhodospirillales bacterium]|nr:Hint domain-containing protein [Rhodospirillales bacterium]